MTTVELDQVEAAVNPCGLCKHPLDSDSGHCLNMVCRGYFPPFPKGVPAQCRCEPNGAICGLCAIQVSLPPPEVTKV